MALEMGDDIRVLFKTANNTGQWLLQRSNRRNRKYKIQNLIIAGKLTNGVIGKAIASDVNTILVLGDNHLTPLTERELEKLELLYQNNIFVFKLGKDWIYNSPAGTQFLAMIFNGDSIYHSQQIDHSVVIEFSNQNSIEAIFNQYRDVLLFPNGLPSNDHYSAIQIIENLNVNNIEMIEHELILSFRLSPEILDYCSYERLYLVWVDNSEFLNLMGKELKYQMDQLTHQKVLFYPIKKRKRYGLNGI